MEHIVAANHRFDPTRICVQIGAKQGKTLAYLIESPLTQHGAHIAFARQVTARGTRFMPRRQQLDQTMGADEPRAPRKPLAYASPDVPR
jgi:hypothetical protein